MWYSTAYNPLPVTPLTNREPVPGEFGSFVWASDREEAEAQVLLRDIGERVVQLWQRRASPAPYIPPSHLIRKRKMDWFDSTAFIHSTCFLSFLAQRSLGLSAFDITGDLGLLHDAIHYTQFGEPKKADLKKRLETVERAVPGYWPKRGV